MQEYKKIPYDFINELVKKTNIVELVKSKITLKKIGKNFFSLCPFHKEKKPSFFVSLKKQFFYCFGCKIYGNAIDFLMKHDRLNFLNAVEELSIIKNLKIPYVYKINNKKNKLKFSLYKAMEVVSNFYHKNLQSKSIQVASSFLKKRGINEKVINIFSLGFAKDNWNDLFLNFCKNDKNKLILYETGMLIKKNNLFYDRFRSRIIFPIKNVNGRVVGFGGRSINSRSPKYLNSPETLIFKKQNQLYGLYEVKKKII